jgi:hypothetical protein
LMMASIFFTERLPGISIFETAGWLRVLRKVIRSSVLASSRAHCIVAGEHDDPEPASSKAGSMPSC